MLQNPEAERTVLGAVFVDNAAMNTVAATLTPDQFANQRNRTIYRAMLKLYEAGTPIDLVTALHELGSLAGEAGGGEYLGSIVDGLPKITNIGEWIKIVRDCHARREMVAASVRLAAVARDQMVTAEEAIAEFQSVLTKLTEANSAGTMHIGAALKLAVVELEKFAASASGITGVDTGFHDLNEITRGWQEGALYVIGGRPGRGKSVFCAQAAVAAGVRGRKVLSFTMEMPPPSVAQRMIFADAEVERWDVRRTNLRDAAWVRITQSVSKLGKLPIWFDCRESPTIAQVRAACRQHQQAHGLDLVIVDYLQRCALDSKMEHWIAVGEIAKGLKTLARALGVPVVAACQLRADAEERRPTMADLAQARQVISAEADMIGFLHPKEPDQWRLQPMPQIDLLIDKQRDGEMTAISYVFEKAKVRFLPMVRGDM